MIEIILAIILGGGTIALAIITGWYASTTNKILFETQKQIKVVHIEKRLANLYSPIISNEDMLYQWPPFSPSSVPHYKE